MLLNINSRGQITLPKILRSTMKLNFGDSVVLIQRDDEIVLRAVTDTLFDLRGSVPVDGVQDFDAVIRNAKEQMAREVAG